MYISHDWLFSHASPDLAEARRLANEARAARSYAAWRWMWTGLTHALAAMLARQREARRLRQNRLVLESLDAATLRDIGLSPGELRDVAAISARCARRSGLSVAESRRLLDAEREAQQARRGRARAAARPPRVVRAQESVAPVATMRRPVLPRCLRVVPQPTAECCG